MNINMQGKCIFNIFIILIKIKKAPNNVSKTCEQTRDWSDELKASAVFRSGVACQTHSTPSVTYMETCTYTETCIPHLKWNRHVSSRSRVGIARQQQQQTLQPRFSTSGRLLTCGRWLNGCTRLPRLLRCCLVHPSARSSEGCGSSFLQRITCTPHSEDPGGGWQPPPSPEDEINGQMLQFIVNR